MVEAVVSFQLQLLGLLHKLLLVLNTRVLVDPAKDLTVPDERVFVLQHPLRLVSHHPLALNPGEGTGDTYMVLIGENEQLARHLLCLQDIKGRQALGNGQAVVKLAVDNLHHTYKTSCQSPKHHDSGVLNRVSR